MALSRSVTSARGWGEGQGRTRLILHSRFPSKEAWEGSLASGMERGMRVTLDQLDAGRLNALTTMTVKGSSQHSAPRRELNC
jgi:hypothetical protein